MGIFNASEKKILACLAETFIPKLTDNENERSLFSLSATDPKFIDEMETFLALELDRRQLWQFKILLKIINSRLVCGLTGGFWRPFASLSLKEREIVFHNWKSSRIKLIKKIFNQLKNIIGYHFYFISRENFPHPSWSLLGLDVESAWSADIKTPKTIQPLTIKGPSSFTCDVLIIGSGAGGGVVAGELSKEGLDVMIVEKGNYFNEVDFNSNNLGELTKNLFERGGIFNTHDNNVKIIAGSTLGGGTVVNWTGAVRTPDAVLKEWAQKYQFADAVLPLYQEIMDTVSSRLNVGCDESRTENHQCALLEKGCLKLNYAVKKYPRNVKGCVDCSFCHWGCRYGAKQSTLKTYLQDAFDRGARILVKSDCRKILHEKGVASGALIVSEDDAGKKHEIQIKAKVVVVAGGSLHTPPILLRSGLSNPNIGKHFKIHPTSGVFGFFDEPVNPWHGAPMTRLCTEFENLDGQGYGVRIVTGVHHPAIYSGFIPWSSALDHRKKMLQYPFSSFFGVLCRDYYGGEIKIDREGNPQYYYSLHPYDEKHLRKGLVEGVRIAIAAGAKEVFSTMNPTMVFRIGGSQKLDDFLTHLEQAPFSPAASLFSLHLMSSCRMAGDPKLGAINVTGETFEIKNLFVADASALPTSTGVNPALSTASLAFYIAQHIKKKF